jgi:hypothetical protein
MKYQISLTIHDNDFNHISLTTGDSLVELLSKFILELAKTEELHRKQLENELNIARLVLKNNNLDEDDIPF